MDAVTCKLFASLCIWTYVFIECSNGLPFHGFLTSANKFAREVANLNDADETEPLVREEGIKHIKAIIGSCDWILLFLIDI